MARREELPEATTRPTTTRPTTTRSRTTRPRTTPAISTAEVSEAARGMSHGEILARWARRRPDKAAFVCEGRSVTYRELDDRANAVARALLERGVRKGDRVAVLMGNNIGHIETMFGVFRLGAILVPISVRLTVPEVAFVVEDSGAATLVVDEVFSATAGAVRAVSASLSTCIVNGTSAAAAGPGAERYGDIVGASSTPLDVVVTEHDPACIMYTSGTTGRPKGALLDHFNLLMNSINSLQAQRLWAEDEVWYGVLPLFHIGGLNGILLYLLLGGTSVIVPLGHFDPAQAVDDLVKYEVTSCCFVQMQWSDICDHLMTRDFPATGDFSVTRDFPATHRPPFSLRRIVWGTSNAVVELLEAMSRLFSGVEIYNFFGQTEMSSVTCVLPPEAFSSKIGSVGKPVLNVEARIVDEHMHDVPPETVGEIVYRGPTVMQGYWGLPEETAEVLAGGWFHSGDLCRMDADGYIYVVDRKKDMIISGGENIYSAELEAVLSSQPGVAEVAVIGVPDPRWGETPLAVVVPTDPARPPTLEDLVDHCRQRIASYKKPSGVVVVDALPRNAAGKVVKPELRRRFATLDSPASATEDSPASATEDSPASGTPPSR